MSESVQYRPKDQQWLQEACELVKQKFPETHGFVILAVPVSGTDRLYYASNVERGEAIEALKEWIAYQGRVDNWMKHDEGPPPKPPGGP